MEEEEQIIPYRSVPRWVVPVVTSTSAIAAVSIVFMGVSLGSLVYPGLPHATAIVLETFIRAVGVLLCMFICFLIFELARHDCLLITKSGLRLPLLAAPGMLFRRSRQWSDVARVMFGAMLLEDKKGTYEYELESGPHQKKLFIYFKSGGHVSLDLTKIPRAKAEILFKAVEEFCIKYSRTPPKRDPRRIAMKSQAVTVHQTADFTQLWEDELQEHFSATNFVPVEKGRTLMNGKLTVLMQLSSGGQSAVYLVENEDRQLAVVKETALPSSVPEEIRNKARQLFQREAALLRQLDHQRIAKVLDFFAENGRDYLLLEFVPGENLRQIVKKRGVQSERSVVSIARQITEILDYLHSLSPPVVHRDVTPDNILVKEDGQVILIDFGAANQLIGTATGTMVGKQCYIAPEQFRGKASIQSDYYALGCTLYFLLTGQDPEALSTSHPRLMRGDVADELDDLVRALTEIETSNRISSVGEILDRLDKVSPDTVLSIPT